MAATGAGDVRTVKRALDERAPRPRGGGSGRPVDPAKREAVVAYDAEHPGLSAPTIARELGVSAPFVRRVLGPRAVGRKRRVCSSCNDPEVYVLAATGLCRECTDIVTPSERLERERLQTGNGVWRNYGGRALTSST
jgi:hypothetical protein